MRAGELQNCGYNLFHEQQQHTGREDMGESTNKKQRLKEILKDISFNFLQKHYRDRTYDPG